MPASNLNSACERTSSYHPNTSYTYTQRVHGYPVCCLRHSLGRSVSLNLGVAMNVQKKKISSERFDR